MGHRPKISRNQCLVPVSALVALPVLMAKDSLMSRPNATTTARVSMIHPAHSSYSLQIFDQQGSADVIPSTSATYIYIYTCIYIYIYIYTRVYVFSKREYALHHAAHICTCQRPWAYFIHPMSVTSTGTASLTPMCNSLCVMTRSKEDIDQTEEQQRRPS